jgi:N-acetylneuraminate synthase
MFNNYQISRCYVIAEIGGNFTTIDEATLLIDEAAKCGVDAVKLQTYKAETLSSRHAIFDMENTGVTSQFDLFRKYEVDVDMHRAIFKYAQTRGLDWFSSPSHKMDVELLETCGVGAYKIGSDDAVNLPFLRFVASTGKPIILSTGMCTLDEVKESVEEILAVGCPNLMLLHAITSYPTRPENVFWRNYHREL